jgi:ATP-dependent helicase/nuclease subunit B
MLVQGDLGSVVQGRWLQLAWPELVEPDAPLAPIAVRGDMARSLAAPNFRILKSDSLEHEAVSATMQVLEWLDQGVGRIALVALDRLTARRVRALLERAQVLVADQSGWKLSTTSAAAAVMRLLDLVVGDFRVRDLLDWLRSPFAWWGLPQRLEAASLIDRLASRDAVSGGLKSLERLLARFGAGPGGTAVEYAVGPAAANQDVEDGDGGTEAASALAILRQLQVHARQLRAEHAPDRIAQALAAALEALGMREALRGDPIGIDVLDQFERLRSRLPGTPTTLSLADFRELLAQHFENANASDPAIESPVVMTSLAGACQRAFGAILLLGGGAEHLPRAGAAGTLMSRAVRHDLGLPTQADGFELQQRQLALLLATAPRSAATWRCMEGDEPRPLSVWLDRLRELALRAGWPDPVGVPPPAARPIVPIAARRPAPMAAGMLPARLSASACQSLVDCPYQFFGRYLLGLRRRDPVDPVAGKRDLGVALHAIVHRLHRSHDDAAIASMTDADLERMLAAMTDEQFGRDMQHRPALIAYRQRTLELIPSYIAWLRARADSGRQLKGTECDFDRPLELGDGRIVRLTGRIDRIDRHPDGSLEVIDLKARTHAAVRKDARDPGERIQLPFYALALGPDARHASYLSFERDADPLKRRTRSVQSFSVEDPLQPWVDLLEDRLRDALGRVAQGGELPALGVQPACGYCEMRGLCRRAEWAQGLA